MTSVPVIANNPIDQDEKSFHQYNFTTQRSRSMRLLAITATDVITSNPTLGTPSRLLVIRRCYNSYSFATGFLEVKPFGVHLCGRSGPN